MNNKESDLNKIFTNKKNSIKIPYIQKKGDLFGNNIINNNNSNNLKISQKRKSAVNNNKISLLNKNENFKYKKNIKKIKNLLYK